MRTPTPKPYHAARCRRRATGLALAALLGAAGCATRGPSATQVPAWRGEAPPVVADADVLGLTSEMTAWLDRYVAPYDGAGTRRYLLALGLGPAGAHGFRYEASSTRTAAGTFHARSGNCISHAHLLVALGRAAGLAAHYERIEAEPEWTERDDAWLVGNHVVAAFRTAQGTWLADPAGLDISPETPRRRLTDAEARSLHHNNLAAEALLDTDDLALAYAHAAKAVATAPGLADGWINLGVVLGRNGQADGAERAYRAALAADDANLSAMSNLHGLYLAQGRAEEAADMQARVERHRRKNPYYLLRLADEAERDGRPDASRKLVEEAVKRKGTDPRLHFALARARWLTGDAKGAREALEAARSLAPPGFEAAWEPPPAVDRASP